MSQHRLAQLNLIIALGLWSTIGVLRRFIALPSGVIALMRGIVGTLFLIGLVYFLHKGFDWQKIREQGWKLALGGFFLGTNWALLFEAYRCTNVAVAELSYFTNPVFIILLAPFVLHEKILWKQWACILTALVGVFCVNGANGFSVGSEDTWGIFLALVAAVEVAGVVLVNKLIGEIGTYERSVTQLGIATLVLIPYTLMTEDLSALSFHDVNSWVITLILGMVHTGIAYYCYYIGLAGVSAQESCILGYTDPILVIIWSCLIFGETLSPLQFCGAVLIVGSMLFMELRTKV